MKQKSGWKRITLLRKTSFKKRLKILAGYKRQSVSYPRTRASTSWTCTDLREVRLPQRFFLRFSLLDVPYIYEGSSRRIFPWELGGPDSVG